MPDLKTAIKDMIFSVILLVIIIISVKLNDNFVLWFYVAVTSIYLISNTFRK